jgi:hypothetical protein
MTAVRNAVRDVKDPFSKSEAQIRGDIYTNLRRELVEYRELYSHVSRKRRRVWQHSPVWRAINEIISDQRGVLMCPDENSKCIADLRKSLAEMNNAQKDLERINQRADEVVTRLLKINETLDPNGDEDEQPQQTE